MSALQALAQATSGWALTHPAFLILYLSAVAILLFVLAAAALAEPRDGEIQTEVREEPAGEDITLPCMEAPPHKPDHVFWTSVWAQHVHHDTGEYPTLEMAIHHQLPLNVPGPAGPAPTTARAGDQLAILEREMAGEE